VSVWHAAGTVFKAFAAHVAVFFMRMADFTLTVLRVTRNVVTVMVLMPTATFSMTMFVMVLMPTATFSMTMFVVVLRPAATFIVFIPFMSMNFAAAARFVMAVLVFRLMAVPMPALVTVFMVMIATTASPIFMMMVMRTHFITAVSYIR